MSSPIRPRNDENPHARRFTLLVDEHGQRQYGGLSRMVNRNDDTVCAVLVGGHAVYLDGQPTEVVGTQRTGRFLRTNMATPTLTASRSRAQ